ncbi:MAG: UvrD-helicase domain-containing protein [Acidobacteria bacterium]|nr:UvrD-helicase domain-containing protein [Acidobacteriota bacterium]
MSILDKLNPQQREAVETTDGPMLILAGAGSGKTRVITYRIVWLMDYCGVAPGNMLAVTFTNKAAEEMRSRVESLVTTPLMGRAWISTFHSFCVRLLRSDGHRIGLPRDFSIYDEHDQLSVVKACLRHLGLSEREVKSRAVLTRISHAKNHGRSPEAFYEHAADPLAEKIATVYDLYNKALRQANAVDFDDLLLEAVRLLSQDAYTALKNNQRFHYILVDEYQDTNRSQYDLVRLLTQTRQNLCVVGDEDQSIYSWRGADVRNIVEFERDYPNARIIRLEENYRSTQTILDAATAVVSNNVYRKGKKLWTSRKGGDKVFSYEAPDAENESLFTADWIMKRLRERPGEKIAVLYRTNSQSRLYEEAMRRYGLKYNLVGGFSFYERMEIKDLLAYVKVALNPQDSISLLRIINSPARGIGATTLKRLEEIALTGNISLWDALEKALRDGEFTGRTSAAMAAFRDVMSELQAMAASASARVLLDEILKKTNYQQRWEQEATPESLDRLENIEELLNAAADSVERGETLQQFLDHAALVSDADTYDEQSQITLMTLHSAKGLEFPVVFLGGMEEGLLPHSRSLLSQQALEEERRLCYVGMTRAQDVLIITRAETRRHYGDQMMASSRPSRFWSEIPAHLLQDVSGRPPRRTDPGERFYEYEPEERDGYSSRRNSISNVREYFKFNSDTRKPPYDAAELPPRPAAARGGTPVGLPLGCRVRHSKYGYGTIVRREGEGDEVKLTVSFPGYGVKKLIEKYAGLERV